MGLKVGGYAKVTNMLYVHLACLAKLAFEGNVPFEVGYECPEYWYNGKCKDLEWRTKFGIATTLKGGERDGQLLSCSLRIGNKVNLYIQGWHLEIRRFMPGRLAKVYCNQKNNYTFAKGESKMDKREAAELIKKCKLNCKLWQIAKSKAFQLIELGGD